MYLIAADSHLVLVFAEQLQTRTSHYDGELFLLRKKSGE